MKGVEGGKTQTFPTSTTSLTGQKTKGHGTGGGKKERVDYLKEDGGWTEGGILAVPSTEFGVKIQEKKASKSNLAADSASR